MKKIICLAVVVFSAFSAAPSHAAPRNWCAATKAPKVNVQVATKNIEWVFTAPEKVLTEELRRKDPGRVSPYGANAITVVDGLKTGGIQPDAQIEFGYVTNPDKTQGCLFFDTVTVNLNVVTKVNIASEYRPGTCMHKAIKEHEIKHVNIDRDVANLYAQAIGQAVQAELMRQNIYGPATAATFSALKPVMSARIKQIFMSYSGAMEAERRRRQTGLDNLQEYQRVDSLCSGKRQSY